MDILQLCGSFFPSEGLIASHLEYLKFILLGISVLSVFPLGQFKSLLPAQGSLITWIRVSSGSVNISSCVSGFLLSPLFAYCPLLCPSLWLCLLVPQVPILPDYFRWWKSRAWSRSSGALVPPPLTTCRNKAVFQQVVSFIWSWISH